MKQGTVHKDSFSVPLRFLVDNKHNINLVWVYLNLRKWSIDNGGYVKEEITSQFKRNTRERILPELIKRGWIQKFGKTIKITSIYKIMEMGEGRELTANKIIATVPYSHLKSKKLLQDIIFALVERYIMQGKYISETKGYKDFDRETKRLKRQRIKKNDDDPTKTERFVAGGVGLKNSNTVRHIYQSRISHKMLKSWGYSDKEISRRRKAKINFYFAKEYTEACKYQRNGFWSWKQKKFVKILPTKVQTLSKTVFYKNYPKYTNNLTVISKNNIDSSTSLRIY